jgi:hypothetical protein
MDLSSITNITSGIQGTAQTEAIKLALEKYWPLLAAGGVGAVLLFMAPALIGTYVEKKATDKLVGAVLGSKDKETTLKPKPKTKENWIKVRLAHPDNFIEGSQRTKVVNSAVHVIIAKPKDGGKTKAQAMRFKTQAQFKKAIPGLEKRYGAKLIEKAPGDYGLKKTEKVKAIESSNPVKKLKLPVITETVKKLEKPEINKPEPEPEKKKNKKGFEVGSKVHYKTRGQEGTGTVLSKVEGKNVFNIKKEDGEVWPIPRNFLKRLN